ncbi:MAG: glycosyltransferase, partial [bacterium]
MSAPKAIVVLGMFDLSRLDSARPIRIYDLFTSLHALTPATLISGNRTPRRLAVLRYLLSGGLNRTRAVYVEASTSTATEIDLLFLSMARAAGIPIVVYISDGYQPFPDLYPRRGWKVKLLDWGWRRSIAAYLRLADLLLFPSHDLAACFDHHPQRNKRKVEFNVLPPAGRLNREWNPPATEPPVVVFAGETSYRYGSDLLLKAMVRVVTRYANAHCYIITPNAAFLNGNPARHASWLTVASRTFDELAPIMRAATLAIIPLRVNAYNDLAVPAKLFDFMSYGRPLVVTTCRNTAMLVNELEAGLIVEDNAKALARGIMRLIEDPDLAVRLGSNGYRTIQTAHSWSHRAKQLLQMIEEIEARVK